MRRDTLSRRSLLGGAAALGAGFVFPGAGPLLAEKAIAEDDRERYRAKGGRIRQSVCHWCFKPMDVKTLARNAAALGLESVELVGPEHWPVLQEHGLVCAITGSHGFRKGLAHPENHAFCLEKLRESIDVTAKAGFPNVITFSGMREGMPDDVGLENTVRALKEVAGHAEKKKVNICLEMLNSRVTTHPMKGHPDYMCDSIEWAVEVCDRVASERMKILFDIYHVQIMQGDVITRIRQFKDYIAHYHTAGVPGRGEIDDTQELNYAPIMRAIAETGYKGYVGQEFIPTRDPVDSLEQAVRICDV